MSILNRTITALLALSLAVSAAAQKPKTQSTAAGPSSTSGNPYPSAAENKAAGLPSSWNKVPIPRLHDFKPQEPRRVEFPNGLVVFFQEDHELPVIDGIIRIRGGSRDEPASKVGMISIYGEVWRIGAPRQRRAISLTIFWNHARHGLRHPVPSTQRC